MVLHLLHLTLLLVTASAFVTPNSAPKIGRAVHVITKCGTTKCGTTKCGPSHHQNAFVSVSHKDCRNGVSLTMVPVESNIIASVFAVTVGYIMWQDAAEIYQKKKEKRDKISFETQEVVEEAKAEPSKLEPEEVVKEVKTEFDQLDPEKVVEESKAEIDQSEESMEPSESSNDVEEAEVVGAESFNLGSNILDIKKAIASTLEGEKEKVDRLDAGSQTDINVEEITMSSQEIQQENTPNIEETIVKAPVSGRKRRFVRKSVKKVLMPWRKWSNL